MFPCVCERRNYSGMPFHFLGTNLLGPRLLHSLVCSYHIYLLFLPFQLLFPPAHYGLLPSPWSVPFFSWPTPTPPPSCSSPLPPGRCSTRVGSQLSVLPRLFPLLLFFLQIFWFGHPPSTLSGLLLSTPQPSSFQVLLRPDFPVLPAIVCLEFLLLSLPSVPPAIISFPRTLLPFLIFSCCFLYATCSEDSMLLSSFLPSSSLLSALKLFSSPFSFLSSSPSSRPSYSFLSNLSWLRGLFLLCIVLSLSLPTLLLTSPLGGEPLWALVAILLKRCSGWLDRRHFVDRRRGCGLLPFVRFPPLFLCSWGPFAAPPLVAFVSRFHQLGGCHPGKLCLAMSITHPSSSPSFHLCSVV